MTGIKELPTVYNIPAGFSFADALAQGIWEQAGEDPLRLSAYTILLPSRRACRTLCDAFLRLSGGNAALLPQMRPIGDVDAEEVTLMLSGEEEMPDIPPAISRLERRVLLARLIMKKGDVHSFDQAAALALELGHFLDEVQTEGLSFENLKDLVPENFESHWQKTLEFLKILTEVWPEILKERGVIDYADYRNRLLSAQREVWETYPPEFPVIAAGSTGTVPAAAELLCLVSRLPQGSLVLPGLDAEMDDVSWEEIGAEHPQANMKKLIERLGIDRCDIKDWPLTDPPPVNTARVRLINEAMRPPETTEQWRALTTDDVPPQALDGLTRIDCGTPQEEADVIALLLREALETPGKTAALITPDRRLARRVSVSMKRWGIEIDDSGGQPLTETTTGTWLMLVAEAAEEALAPVKLLAMLKHPVMAAGMKLEEHRGMVQMLDKLALRGPRPTAGFEGLRQAIAGLSDKHPKAAADLTAWIRRIEKYLSDFAALMAGGESVSFKKLVTEHIKATEALAQLPDQTGAERIWAGEAGEAAGQFLSDMMMVSKDIPPLFPAHYISLLRNLSKGITVRAAYGMHPRLSILGQVEARLYSADMVVLGGVNEGTWPALPDHDPWMSRPMRAQYGLPAPEKSISLSSHDFVQAVTAPEVFVTRARKLDGAPTVPARWLLRVETVLKALGMEWSARDAQIYRGWAQDLDTPSAASIPVSRPAPRPPVAARPDKLSVTKIETWLRDPYQIYARYILNLPALDPVDDDPGAAERGTFIHKALEDFVKSYPDQLPEDAVEKLCDFGRTALTEMNVPEEVQAFWWPRFERIATEFVFQEAQWRENANPYKTEISGIWTFDVGGKDFTLTGKADRIDHLKTGGYAVIDYKSGTPPKNSDVAQGLSPQLPLEAVMLREGAFQGVEKGKTADLLYWKVTGSGIEPVKLSSVTGRDVTIEQLEQEAEAGLKQLIETFDDEGTAYFCRPLADAQPRFSDYDHLARVKEWRIGGEEEDAA